MEDTMDSRRLSSDIPVTPLTESIHLLKLHGIWVGLRSNIPVTPLTESTHLQKPHGIWVELRSDIHVTSLTESTHALEARRGIAG